MTAFPSNFKPIFHKEKEKKKKKKYKGISRIDSEHNHTHGWYVRIRQDGKVRSKFFSDGRYDNKVFEALRAAKRWQKKEMEKLVADVLREPVKLKKIPPCIIVTKNKNNNTGVVGVQEIVRENPGGTIYHAFRVCWTETGQPRTKFFSITKYGEKKAFEMACKFRQKVMLKK